MISINSIARILSLILHPMMMPIYLLYFIFKDGSIFSRTPIETKVYCYIITAAVFLFIPLISMSVFKYIRLIKSYKLKARSEKRFLVLWVLIFALTGLWLLTKVPYSNIVAHMYMVLTMSLAGSYLASFLQRKGLSIHMVVMGVVCGFLFILGYKYLGDVREILTLMIFLSGLLASSRLYLKKHTPFQVYQGFLMGLCITIGALI